jgi:lipopolysaccharide transport system permease protein
MTYLLTVWRYRHFWMSLVRMDLRTRYRRSLLGIGWSLLQPLAMTCVLFVVFQQLLKAEATAYIQHLLTGLVCWNFVVACGVQGCQCFFASEAYIRQCPLPLAIYPLRTAIGALFHLTMGLIVVTCLCAVLHGFPGPAGLLSLLPSLAILFVFGWALAVLSGSANVFFQDTQHLAEVGFQIAFYITPIIYRLEDVAPLHRLGWLLHWNPVVPLLTLIRQPLLHEVAPTVSQYLAALVIAGGTAAVATAMLGRLQRKLIFYL